MTKVKDSADRDRSRRDRSRNEEREKLTRRILRGLDLYSERGGEIQRLEEGLYRVPSGTPSGADRDPWRRTLREGSLHGVHPVCPGKVYVPVLQVLEGSV